MVETTQSEPTPPTALTVAGSDSGGGAGIQADLLTFHAHGVFGTTALTAVTAQNTLGVQAVHPLSEEIIAAQITSVCSDFEVLALKTGMLATVSIVELVRQLLADCAVPWIVVDPVMVATTGAPLLVGDGRAAYLRLLPLVDLVTPNLSEAAYLLERPVSDVVAMEEAARALHDLGARHVLVTGGHLQGERSVDVYFDGQEATRLDAPMIRTRHVHGSGCTLSAAIVANLARGDTVPLAIERAKRYVGSCIASSKGWSLGGGSGPLNHLQASHA